MFSLMNNGNAWENTHPGCVISCRFLPLLILSFPAIPCMPSMFLIAWQLQDR